MKAWRLERLGGKLTFADVPMPEVRPGSVLIRVQAAPLSRTLSSISRGSSLFTILHRVRLHRAPVGLA